MSRGTKDGFTLVEVMIAIGLMTVGSLGILAMQAATTRANRLARQVSVAQNVTQIWLDRIDRDVLDWDTPGDVTIGDETLLPADATTGWFIPQGSLHDIPNKNYETGAFGWNGEDLITTTDIRYCTHLRLTWFRPGASVRADVRTFWIREGLNEDADAIAGDTLMNNNCYDGFESTLDINAIPNLHGIAASKTVRYNVQ